MTTTIYAPNYTWGATRAQFLDAGRCEAILQHLAGGAVRRPNEIINRRRFNRLLDGSRLLDDWATRDVHAWVGQLLSELPFIIDRPGIGPTTEQERLEREAEDRARILGFLNGLVSAASEWRDCLANDGSLLVILDETFNREGAPQMRSLLATPGPSVYTDLGDELNSPLWDSLFVIPETESTSLGVRIGRNLVHPWDGASMVHIEEGRRALAAWAHMAPEAVADALMTQQPWMKAYSAATRGEMVRFL